MFEPPTTPRTAGGVLSDAFRLYRSSFLACLPFTALLALAFWLYMTVVMPTLAVVQTPVQMWAAYKSAHVLEAYGSMMIFGLLFQSAMVAVTYGISGGTRVGFAPAAKSALMVLPAALVAVILTMAIAVVGTLALIIPGIYLAVRLQLWLIPVVIDRAGPFAALRVSWDLMRGSWWRTFAIELALFAIIVVLLVVVGFLTGLIVILLTPTSHLPLSARVALIQAINALAYVVIWPLWIAVLVSIYKDLRLRRQANDLATQATTR